MDPAFFNMSILLVDDYLSMRKIIRKILNEMALTNVVEAENGEAAWDMMTRRKIDFVISDWNMPKMSGLELLQTVRNSEQYSDVPFLMVTAESNQEQVIAAIQSGVSNYIVKPFNEKTLAQKVEQIFKLKPGTLRRDELIRMGIVKK